MEATHLLNRSSVRSIYSEHDKGEEESALGIDKDWV